MMARDDAHSEFPSAPVLIAPREGGVVDGRDLRLEWEPVEEASAYRVEVAPDTSFEALLFEENVGTRTAWTPPQALPMDGKTYYWRVLAQDERGWSSGDRVESFISATPDEIEETRRHPEEAGRPEDQPSPYTALVTSAGMEAAAEATGKPSLFEEERRQGVAHEGVEAGQILGIAAAVGVAFLILIPLLLITWTSSVSQEARVRAVVESRYPELREAEAEAVRLLTQYGVVEEEAGVYRIPIDRAMQIMLNQAQAQPGAEGLELPFPTDE